MLFFRSETLKTKKRDCSRLRSRLTERARYFFASSQTTVGVRCPIGFFWNGGEGGRGYAPVRFTMSPSLMEVSLPKHTIPTLSFSRLRAMPLTPDANSTISPD